MRQADRLAKNDRPSAVHQDAPLQVQAHGPRKHLSLQVAALAHQVLHLIAVRHAHHVLLDDRPLVQILRGVVGRRADQLDAGAFAW